MLFPPVTNCHTFSDPLPPLDREVLYGRLPTWRHRLVRVVNGIVLYCIVSIHLYSSSCNAHQSEVLLVRETQREESSGGCYSAVPIKWSYSTVLCSLSVLYLSISIALLSA